MFEAAVHLKVEESHFPKITAQPDFTVSSMIQMCINSTNISKARLQLPTFTRPFYGS